MTRWISPASVGARTVFCFPFAGGGASFYRAWATRAQEVFPRGATLTPVQLPGREERMFEQPFERMPDLVAAAADALAPFLARPYALFGHSMGAMVAFELAHALRERGALMPRALLVSGSPSPHESRLVPPVYHLPHDEFLEKVRRFGGLPDEVLQSRDLLELLLPRLRADLTVTGTYSYTDKPPLTCPITAFGGTNDETVPASMIDSWREHTVAAFDRRLFPGDHFFLVDAAPAILARLAAALE